jgi:hypothetical protein
MSIVPWPFRKPWRREGSGKLCKKDVSSKRLKSLVEVTESCSYVCKAKNIKILTLITYVALCLLCFSQPVRSGACAGKQLVRTSKLVKSVKFCACARALCFDLDDKTERVPAKYSYELKKRPVHYMLLIRYLRKFGSLDNSVGIATG